MGVDKRRVVGGTNTWVELGVVRSNTYLLSLCNPNIDNYDYFSPLTDDRVPIPSLTEEPMYLAQPVQRRLGRPKKLT